jgi:radical SAM-linked protein
VERILFRFSKNEPIRFVGHLDLMRVFERAMRRSGFPVAYSQGFNPRPKMAFGAALTLGATSDWELCQLDLAEEMDEARVVAEVDSLRRQLPPGIAIHQVWRIPLERRSPYLQVNAAEFELVLVGPDAVERLRRFLAEPNSLPAVAEAGLLTPADTSADHVVLRVKLPVGERTGVRIRDLVAHVEQSVEGLQLQRLHRARLWCEQEPVAEQQFSP